MPITLSTDKRKIFEILSGDEYIASLGDWNFIRTKNTMEKINAQDFQIFIYNISPEKTASRIISKLVYQIDISVPSALDVAADMCAEQIIALLNHADLGGMHKLKLLAGPQSLSCPPSNYCIGIRFSVCETEFNQIKKIQKEV